MRQPFSEIRYVRPDLTELFTISEKLLLLIRKKHKDKVAIKENFNAYSYQFLAAVSMYHLALLRSVEENSDLKYTSEIRYFRSHLAKLKTDYLAIFSAIADLEITLSEDSLENAAILNQARRIARTYSKIDPLLLEKEQQLQDQNNDFLDRIHVTVFAETPGLSDSLTDPAAPPTKAYDVSIPEFKIWLRQAKGNVRSRLYNAFSAKLQNETYDNIERFQELLKIRKNQALQIDRSYFDLIIESKKGYVFSRKDIILFKQNLMTYFMPLIDEIRNLRNKRFHLEHISYFDEYKIADYNPVFLLQPEINKSAIMWQAVSNILGGKESFVFETIENGYWSGKSKLQRELKQDVLLLPSWNNLFLLLSLEDDYFNLEDDFFIIGEALSDLSGMVNLKGITTYEQSDLIRKVSGYAMQFLSRRQMKLFAADKAPLFNDLTLCNELMKIPLALAVDTFEATLYDQKNTPRMDLSVLWKQIEKNYNIDFDFLADGFFSEGHSWQINQDLYQCPFSSLERSMALIVILAEQPQKDRRNSLEQKLNALLTSNTDLPFLKRLEISHFASPFDRNTIRKASFAACDMLGL